MPPRVTCSLSVRNKFTSLVSTFSTRPLSPPNTPCSPRTTQLLERSPKVASFLADIRQIEEDDEEEDEGAEIEGEEEEEEVGVENDCRPECEDEVEHLFAVFFCIR